MADGHENQEKICQLIFKAIDDINRQLPKDERLAKSEDTILFDRADGQLDSLGLVNLVAALEEHIADEFQVEIVLADPKAMTRAHRPFATVSSLAEYVSSLVGSATDGQ